jgi:hypothetical protein
MFRCEPILDRDHYMACSACQVPAKGVVGLDSAHHPSATVKKDQDGQPWIGPYGTVAAKSQWGLVIGADVPLPNLIEKYGTIGRNLSLNPTGFMEVEVG